ncbi:Ars binding protein 1, partial [Globisporangium splendens]
MSPSYNEELLLRLNVKEPRTRTGSKGILGKETGVEAADKQVVRLHPSTTTSEPLCIVPHLSCRGGIFCTRVPMKRKSPPPSSNPSNDEGVAPSFAAPSAAASDAFASQPPPVKKKRMTQPVGNLTNAQKRLLCVKFSQVKMTQQELCVWAKEEFSLVNLPHQSTISKILARAGELTSMTSKDLSARRKGLVTCPELDTALCNWVLYARQNNKKLSGDMIKEKARQLAATLGLGSKMTFSNGWLGGFKKRHNIRLGGGATTGTTGAAVTHQQHNASSPHSLDSALSTSVAAIGLGGVAAIRGSLQNPGEASAFGASPVDQFAAMSATLASTSPTAAAASAAISSSIRELQEICKMYHPTDIFTMSETGLYYALSPEKPASGGRGARQAATAKNYEKERLTIVLAVNAEGSERLEPFFIGTTKLPKEMLQTGGGIGYNIGIGGASAGGLLALDVDEPSVPFQYRDNPKAWMTPVLFQEWISTLDTKLRDIQRTILLLIPQAPSHICISLELTNIRVEMLPPPPSTSSALPTLQSPYQPFESGIFAAFKRRYRRHHMHHALDRFEAGVGGDLYKLDLVQAMRWVRDCWMHMLPASLLKHFWDRTELITHPAPAAKPSPQTYHAMEELELRMESDICDTVAALQVARPMTIDEFLNPSGEITDLHCTGMDESDFILSVGGSSSTLMIPTTTEGTDGAAKALDPLAPGAKDSSSEGNGAGVALASSSNSGVTATAFTVAPFGAPRTSNEQLLVSLKVLLPELDRLRFDEHTKTSIRIAFRKLKDKEAEAQQQPLSSDAKQQRHHATRKAMMMAGSISSAAIGISSASMTPVASAGDLVSGMVELPPQVVEVSPDTHEETQQQVAVVPGLVSDTMDSTVI